MQWELQRVRETMDRELQDMQTTQEVMQHRLEHVHRTQACDYSLVNWHPVDKAAGGQRARAGGEGARVSSNGAKCTTGKSHITSHSTETEGDEKEQAGLRCTCERRTWADFGWANADDWDRDGDNGISASPGQQLHTESTKATDMHNGWSRPSHWLIWCNFEVNTSAEERTPKDVRTNSVVCFVW
jgi:hypothetical protein